MRIVWDVSGEFGAEAWTDEISADQSRSCVNVRRLPVDLTVQLAFTSAQWGDERILSLVVERIANECATSLADWDAPLRKGARGVEHSDGWECKLFKIADRLDLVVFLPFLYRKIVENYSPVRTLFLASCQ